MRTLWAAATALVVFAVAGNAFAQSTTPNPYVPGPWDGAYVGLNGGAVRGSDALHLSQPVSPVISDVGGGHLGNWGGFAGGQIGINRELPGLIMPVVNGFVGLEADMNYAGVSASRSTAITGVDLQEKFTNEFLATGRVRIGATFWEQLLLYVTGGVAVGNPTFKDGALYTPTPTYLNFSGSQGGLRPGWVGGAGAEWMFLPGWSVKVEYLHIDFGKSDQSFATPAGTFVFRNFLTMDVARIGVNYKFWSF
jgi:opacity protein-like surface antigen